MATVTKVRNRGEQDFVNQYLKEIRHYPMLTKKEEAVLIKAAQSGDKVSYNKVLTSNLRFVVSVSIKYQNQGLAMPELINEGNIGLMEAIKRFDISKYNIKFISYAVWWIRQSIIKSLYETSRLVRVSAEKESKYKKVNYYAEQSLQRYGNINYEYVAMNTDSSADDVWKILGLSKNSISMDKPLDSDSGSSLADIMEDTNSTETEDFLYNDSLKSRIAEALTILTVQEKIIIEYYFGLGYETNFNLEQIGNKMNLSKERVRQVKKRALKKINENFRRETLLDVA